MTTKMIADVSDAHHCVHVHVTDGATDETIADVFAVAHGVPGLNCSWTIFVCPPDGPPAIYSDEIVEDDCDPEVIAQAAVRHHLAQKTRAA